MKHLDDVLYGEVQALCSTFSRLSRRSVSGFVTTLAVTLTGALVATPLSANQTPYVKFVEDRSVVVGDGFSFDVIPEDPDGVVPGLSVQNLPVGAEFTDNGNGTRKFSWLPGTEAVGEHLVRFLAVDAVDSTLRHHQNVKLTVTQALALDETSQADIPAPQSDGNSIPTIDPVPNVSVLAGTLVKIKITPRDADGTVPGLNAHALPAGSEFVDNRDGSRSFLWVPSDAQEGKFDLVFVAFDAVDSALRAQIEVSVEVGPSQTSPEESEPLQSDQIVSLPPVDDARPDENQSADANGVDAGNVDIGNVNIGNVDIGNAAEETTSNSSGSEGSSGNRAPYFEGLQDQFVTLGETLSMIIVPRDPDGDVPGMFADRLPFNASLLDNFDGTRTLRWRPFPESEGVSWLTFTAVDAKDSGLQARASFKVNVINNGTHNFEPVINGINNPVIRAGDTLSQLVQPVDPDGDVPRLEVLNAPAGSEFVDNRDGTRTLRWKTDAGDVTVRNGIDTPHVINFLATDARDPSMTDDHVLRVSVIEPQTLERTGERLRTLADRRGLLIGHAAMLKASSLADSQVYRQIASEEFNIVTPENSHKWGWIQPFRGEFDFEDADELADYAQRHGMKLHGHPLVWHRQLPAWVQNLELDEVESVMLQHIDALTTRYKGKVAMWDVINEAFEDDGSLRKSVWQRAMGSEYISRAYHRARQIDPAAVLIYNDYDVAWKNDKSDAMYNMLKSELARGTPIDAVGFQMHFWTQFDQYESLVSNLQRFADLGLDLYITELDVAMTAEGQEQLQADVFEKIVDICLQQSRCKAIQTWGFTDRYSWRYRHKPLLFTERYDAKPAYYSIQKALQ